MEELYPLFANASRICAAEKDAMNHRPDDLQAIHRLQTPSQPHPYSLPNSDVYALYRPCNQRQCQRLSSQISYLYSQGDSILSERIAR